jgi:hypothetical protein
MSKYISSVFLIGSFVLLFLLLLLATMDGKAFHPDYSHDSIMARKPLSGNIKQKKAIIHVKKKISEMKISSQPG